jgi:hypothetical protein
MKDQKMSAQPNTQQQEPNIKQRTVKHIEPVPLPPHEKLRLRIEPDSDVDDTDEANEEELDAKLDPHDDLHHD